MGNNNIITVTSPVAAPVRLRYAWKNNPLRANVFGTTGLPMAPMEMGF